MTVTHTNLVGQWVEHKDGYRRGVVRAVVTVKDEIQLVVEVIANRYELNGPMETWPLEGCKTSRSW